jgi:dihydroorotase
VANQFPLPNGWEEKHADSLLLKNVKLCDPYAGEEIVSTHIFIKDGNVAALGDEALKLSAKELVDLNGKMVSPGWFDLHVHLREPGYEYKETVETGLNSALVGGFTGVACMPNTEPALDNAAVVKWLMDSAKTHPVSLSVVAAATKDRAGKELTELADLAGIGVRAVSDDGSPVADSGMVRRIMEYGSTFGVVFFSHAEEKSLVGKGVMNESVWSTTLGLPGMPTVAEDVMVARDILLAEYLNCRVHICHIS